MKHSSLYKKYALFAITGGMLLLTSCIKNYRDGEPQFNNLQPVVLIPEGGLAAFGSQALNYPPDDEADTFYFRINYAATNVAPADEKVTLSVDKTALDAYNGSSAVQYIMFPTGIYSFTSTEVTIKAGQSYSDPIPVVLHPNKVDPTQNLMLPISITAAPSNTVISGNFGTLYLHFIGNPVAGTYNGSGARYNYSGAISYSYPGPYPTPVSTLDLGPYYPKVLAPDDPHTIEVPYVNLGNPYNLVVTMDDDLNIVSVEPNSTLAGILSNFSVYLATYDKNTKTFHFITHYNNGDAGTGDDRIADETLTKQ
ncbi:MAG TPA: DUF1735 domain-containing protein [Chitinophagaceae bacterium]|nr:DUF1735 domain-containing protein [Chitinophagaceae bacterium]